MVSRNIIDRLPTGLNPSGFSWDKAPAGFDQSGTLSHVFTYSPRIFNAAMEFILSFNLNTNKASMAVDVNGRWYDTASTADWPVFDRMFGRTVWHEFVEAHTDDVRLEIDADERAEAIRMTTGVACALHFADLVDAWRYSRADDAARVEVKGRTIAFAFEWDAEARTHGFTYTVYSSPLDAFDPESELTTHGVAVADEDTAEELLREAIGSLA